MRRTLPALFRCTNTYFHNPKVTTGITGLPVIPNARVILKDLYEKILTDVQQFPPNFGYRIDLENVINHRLTIISQETECGRIEDRIGDGQIESLIADARNELDEAFPAIHELKPWAAPDFFNTDVEIVIEQRGEDEQGGPMNLDWIEKEGVEKVKLVKEQTK